MSSGNRSMSGFVPVAELLAHLESGFAHSGGDEPPVVTDLDAGLDRDGDPRALARALASVSTPVVGRSTRPLEARWHPVLEQFACTLVPDGAAGDVPDTAVPVPDVDAAATALVAATAVAPRAAATVHDVLRVTSRSAVHDGLIVESLAYSMLLAGPEHARWRAGRPPRPVPPLDGEPPVLLERCGAHLRVTLNRPRRHNAFGRHMRDALCEAFEFVERDDTVERVTLDGRGPSFCSGGDLDEFGRAPDVATAHLIRVGRSVAARVDRRRDRVRVQVHGACIGAGVEIPAFAGRVVAETGTTFRLPELAMGLIPGAGGTVGIPRRIGRWRAAYLALSGATIDARTALRWGLVDALGD